MLEQKTDRARATRRIFVARAVVTDVETEKEVHGVISNLSLFGCYVESQAPFNRGVTVQVTITHNGQKFMVVGKVAHALASKGMGISFKSMQAADQATLEKWMERLRKP